jgi:hypothetical protein
MQAVLEEVRESSEPGEEVRSSLASYWLEEVGESGLAGIRIGGRGNLKSINGRNDSSTCAF